MKDHLAGEFMLGAVQGAGVVLALVLGVLVIAKMTGKES
jgi:hypothetical protein